MSEEEKLDQRLAVRVTKTEKDIFEAKAKQEGKTASQALLLLVRQYISKGDVGDERLRKVEEELAAIKKHLGELQASGMKIAS
ncbi:MAG: hypothetical protein V7L26_14240 [Nostoc sp.]|uniref:hypothetical protein n=1 Tax=Nostoc sp. TaxID=1180 RepID=UPI002FEED295